MRYTTAMAWRALQSHIKTKTSLSSSRTLSLRAIASKLQGGVSADELDVLENSAEPEEQVDVDGDNEAEETMEEEVEYEEVEEEEIEEAADEADSQRGSDGAEEIDEERKHAELLALPPHGTEVYFGGIPPDASEEDLKELCEYIGAVTEVRIMKGKDLSESRGYAFVSFRRKELASKAIEELNNTEFKGKKTAVQKTGPGVNLVELLKDLQNPSRNRGFAFIEYYNHACAEYSRNKMSKPEFKLDDNAPTVSWADPRNAGSSTSFQVKAVYVKNLPEDITQDCLRQLFEHHGKVTKVVLPPAKPGHEKNRFGFVHFAERSSAMKALKNTEKYEIDGQVLDCSLAKPHTDQKPSGGPNSQKSSLYSNFPPRLGYGLDGGAYGAFGAGFGAAGLTQPVIYGRGSTPAGMAMMPMLLPDGRIGYVLQQPGMQAHSSPQPQGDRGRGAGSSSGGRSSNDRGHSRYNPY
ncbi:hypothetical protein OIU77_017649 [Salix suchowensis]|uniref:RRM domain-containing protein n=1 Tax=Salix suchowensis TaxID=1278906 RepID=A0ABQ8ZPN0_9ROSI|nr:hypothetical protein OIU77_017649 [Salix suchowensis]